MELTAPDVCSINSALKHAGQEAPEFLKGKIDKMFLMKIIEPAKSEWAVAKVFATKKLG